MKLSEMDKHHSRTWDLKEFFGSVQYFRSYGSGGSKIRNRAPIPMCYGLSRFSRWCYSIGYSRPCTQATMDGLYGCRSSTITYPTTHHRYPTTWRPTNFIRQKIFYNFFCFSILFSDFMFTYPTTRYRQWQMSNVGRQIFLIFFLILFLFSVYYSSSSQV